MTVQPAGRSEPADRPLQPGAAFLREQKWHIWRRAGLSATFPA